MCSHCSAHTTKGSVWSLCWPVMWDDIKMGVHTFHQLSEPVFWNQPQSYTWPLKKIQLIHKLDFTESWPIHMLLSFELIYPFISSVIWLVNKFTNDPCHEKTYLMLMWKQRLDQYPSEKYDATGNKLRLFQQLRWSSVYRRSDSDNNAVQKSPKYSRVLGK